MPIPFDTNSVYIGTLWIIIEGYITLFCFTSNSRWSIPQGNDPCEVHYAQARNMFGLSDDIPPKGIESCEVWDPQHVWV